MGGRKTLFTISFFSLFLIVCSVCHGFDTDLYVLSGVNIPPNVLIILDSSASMDEVTSGQIYDYTIDYSTYVPANGTVYPPDEVYIKSSSNWVDTKFTTSTLNCTDLVTNYLLPYGMATNYSNPDCRYTKKDFQTGNFRNYLQATGGPGGNRPRFGLANGIIHSYVDTTSGVRFAVMAFNRDNDGNTVREVTTTTNGITTTKEYVFGDSGDDSLDAKGGQLLGFVDENKNGKTDLFNALAILKNDSWSPLAETLYEAGVVFQNGSSKITGTNYSNPKLVNYYCQKNYVLIISDGVPTKDSDSRLSLPAPTGAGIPDENKSGKIELDDVAKYLYNLDLSGGTATKKQNIKTYTIGFSMAGNSDSLLMERTAQNGGGKYFYVWSSQSFDVAFQSFIQDVLEESTSYVAPVVPISQMERTNAGNRMYLAMFKPTENNFWRGNIKKYCIATKNSSGQIVDCSNKVISDPTIKLGDVLDQKGKPVICTPERHEKNDDGTVNPFGQPGCDSDSENKIIATVQSYWSTGVDGASTDQGGVGKRLASRDFSANPRKIYTYFGSDSVLSNSSNAFDTNIAPEMLGLTAGETTERTNLVKFIQGYDAYYENQEGSRGPDQKKDWILGSLVHSRPVVIHYGDDYQNRSVIYAGANDGMLHAFEDNDDSGDELWAFIPRDLLPSLKNLRGQLVRPDTLPFYVDGAPKAYIERDATGKITTAILIFGERRGGNHYIALNVKNPDSPEFLWDISPAGIKFGANPLNTTTDYQKLGQTWSTPLLGKIKLSTGDKWVAFIGGGYDVNQDLTTPASQDSGGTAVYVIDVLNGNRIWGYSNANNANMKYCIPSDVAHVDTDGNGYMDRLYVSDISGQVWRFDIGDSNPSNWSSTGKIVFDANQGVSNKRKVFYPPDVTLESNYEMIFFGTGDREHPKDTSKVNRLYAIKDRGLSTLSETNLYDATDDLVQTGDAAQINALNSKEGWYIRLGANAGEKCLSNSVLFYGVIYYTTFQPTFDPTGTDPCFMSQGIARLYALDYRTGNAVFNLDHVGTLGDLGQSDRSTEIGVSIPSGVIITFISGTTVAYGGVEMGIFRPPLPVAKTLFPVNWRIVF